MQHLKNISIPGNHRKPVLADVAFKENDRLKAIVIFSHGFKGFKDWGHFDEVAERFADAGFIFIKFNFSHNGTTPGSPAVFGDLESFGNNNYIIELDDLKNVIDWAVKSELLKKESDIHKIYLLGHSRGGGITILKAGEDHRIRKMATWAAVSDLFRNKKRTIDTWKKAGVVYAKNARTNQEMPLYYQFYENLMANKERLNIHRALKRFDFPFLIVHGTRDEAVPFHDAEDLFKTAKHGKILRIDGGDHTFGVRHPYNGELPEHAREVLEETIAFFQK